MGVRISAGIASHGVALNVDCDLSLFQHVVPCGLSDAVITSMASELARARTDEDERERVEADAEPLPLRCPLPEEVSLALAGRVADALGARARFVEARGDVAAALAGVGS